MYIADVQERKARATAQLEAFMTLVIIEQHIVIPPIIKVARVGREAAGRRAQSLTPLWTGIFITPSLRGEAVLSNITRTLAKEAGSLPGVVLAR